MRLCWLGGPDQCGLRPAHRTTENSLLLKEYWKIHGSFPIWSGSCYKTFSHCITGVRAVSVFLAMGVKCAVLWAPPEMGHAMDFACGFHEKNLH